MKYLLIILIAINLYSADIELSLKKFAGIVSSQHKINIIIDNSIKKNEFIFYIQKDKNTIMLPAFKKMLDLKDLKLTHNIENNFYFIEKKIIKEIKKNLYSITLDSLVYEDISSVLKSIDDLKYSYIENSNTLILICYEDLYKQIKKIVNINDSISKQFKLKINVIETNVTESKERGFEINAYAKKETGAFQNFVNILTVPSSAPSNIFSSASSGAITASIKYLNGLGVSEIRTSPMITVQSGKEVNFSSVDNIPYLNSTSSIDGVNSSTTQNITYKDVGLKLKLLPVVVDDTVFIDMNFIIENIIDKSSQTPTTFKRELNNHFQLKANTILVLSGITYVDKSSSRYAVPLLSDIPLLGWFFDYEFKNEIKRNLSITIEILSDDYILETACNADKSL